MIYVYWCMVVCVLVIFWWFPAQFQYFQAFIRRLQIHTQIFTQAHWFVTFVAGEDLEDTLFAQVETCSFHRPFHQHLIECVDCSTACEQQVHRNTHDYNNSRMDRPLTRVVGRHSGVYKYKRNLVFFSVVLCFTLYLEFAMILTVKLALHIISHLSGMVPIPLGKIIQSVGVEILAWEQYKRSHLHPVIWI